MPRHDDVPHRGELVHRSGRLLEIDGVVEPATVAEEVAPQLFDGMTPGSPATRATTRPALGKGRADSRVTRWDVVTIGNLSRNRYWGEPDARGVRAVICTCSLVRGSDFRLLVDPSIADAEQMARELDRRTGLNPRDVTAAFVTHEHGDHYAGLAHSPTRLVPPTPPPRQATLSPHGPGKRSASASGNGPLPLRRAAAERACKFASAA